MELCDILMQYSECVHYEKLVPQKDDSNLKEDGTQVSRP